MYHDDSRAMATPSFLRYAQQAQQMQVAHGMQLKDTPHTLPFMYWQSTNTVQFVYSRVHKYLLRYCVCVCVLWSFCFFCSSCLQQYKQSTNMGPPIID